MNHFTITNLFIGPSLLLFIAISSDQPTLKRKTTVMCLYLWLLALLFILYPAYVERRNLPPLFFWFDIALAVFFLLSSIWLYQWSNVWIRKIEDMKQRSAKRAAYVESLRYKEDEEPA